MILRIESLGEKLQQAEGGFRLEKVALGLYSSFHMCTHARTHSLSVPDTRAEFLKMHVIVLRSSLFHC